MVVITSLTATHSRLDGTDSAEQQEVKWWSPVLIGIAVARAHRVGSAEPTLQWLMGRYSAKCVLLGLRIAVVIHITSVFVTVETSMYID